MSFNSQSYYRNKAKRSALKLIEDARAMKARIGTPDACIMDSPKAIASMVLRARLQWKTYLSYRGLDRMNEDYKRCRRGEMSYADFNVKYTIERKRA
jgi:hypothetical protein